MKRERTDELYLTRCSRTNCLSWIAVGKHVKFAIPSYIREIRQSNLITADKTPKVCWLHQGCIWWPVLLCRYCVSTLLQTKVIYFCQYPVGVWSLMEHAINNLSLHAYWLYSVVVCSSIWVWGQVVWWLMSPLPMTGTMILPLHWENGWRDWAGQSPNKGG